VESLDGILETTAGFQWDDSNSDKNWSRHGVSQLECEQIFFNQPLLLASDPKHTGHEVRFFALGRTEALRELAVVFTIRDKRIRVSSARPMSRRERREYARAKSKEA
jgi:hypothetical protein